MSSKPNRGPSFLPALLAAVLILAAGDVADAQTAAPPVTVAQPAKRSVTEWTDYTGQFVAVDSVDVRARVAGYLTEIHFTDGQMVDKGDLLFVIDPRPYEIAVASARARLDQAAGSKEYASRQLSRAGELRRKDFVAESTLDQRTEASRGAGATVEAARAALREAELNLSFTRVTAPISGRIGARQVSVGNLVSGGPSIAAPTLLTTIVSQAPIHFIFDMTEADFLTQARRGQGKPGAALSGAQVRIGLVNEVGWPREGRIDFVDNQFDRGTGTIRIRAVLPNDDHAIAAGSFGRVRLAASEPYESLLVPDTAIVTDQARKLVMTVKDGTVVPKPVRLGPLQDGLRVIRDGLAADDQVIVNGLMRARPGAKVTPQPGKIE
ncbi:efflux RND transporter periplasmic adaptor subunit [Magnetospirillum sp. SS-4]|uniref:efflux RND transporter periplasmic adaptor subunit n=1 Tax=Magnetospirillum sp. SS-4 TaxID=2681465 RepID=UPI0013817C82|nr:efflux RND transporter periplasmic adaptor subunit [Magnetospirillum sp. SS-4]CAA7612447.1 Membrane-fusion protein [Magnetospirillum sp. SS-4]